MPNFVLVRFQPHNREVQVAKGENLLKAAMEAGVYSQASCGGEGVCGKCRVLIEKGDVESSRGSKISEEEYGRGLRQACQTRILSDLEVRIPVESELDKRLIARTRERVAAGRKAPPQDLEALGRGWGFSPALRQHYVERE